MRFAFKKALVAVLAIACVWSVPLKAEDLDSIQTLTQADFRALNEDLTGVLGYKGATPAEPMGLTGFDVGLSVTSVSLEHADVWQQATSSSDQESTVYVPRLTVAKGLPFDIDVGVSYFAAPGSNIKNWAGELKYSIYQGSTLMPAVAVRATHSRLSGVDELDFNADTLELSVSKGFVMLTPYAGIGTVRVDGQPQSTAANVLVGERFSDLHTYVGLVMSPGLLSVSAEYDNAAGVGAFTLKISVGF